MVNRGLIFCGKIALAPLRAAAVRDCGAGPGIASVGQAAVVKPGLIDTGRGMFR